MRLSALEPEWLYDATPTTHRSDDSRTPTTAQGIVFLCPKCFVKNSGDVGTHSILVWFKDRGVPDECKPLPRWTATGTSFDDLSIMPSIDLTKDSPGEWHGWITAGQVS